MSSPLPHRIHQFATAQPRKAALAELTLRLLLVWLWLSSGWSKILAFSAFQRGVYDYQILPVPAATVVSYGVPGLELLLGGYLLLGLYRKQAAWGSAALLAIFCAAIGWAMANGLEIDCGCMIAGNNQPVGWPKLTENAALIGVSLLVAVWPTPRLTVDGWQKNPKS